MFIFVLLNVEYMDITSRKMWYLKNLYHCKQNGWPLITHEYLGNNFNELQDSISDRFIDQFEMERLTAEDLENVEQYFIPDVIFDEIEKDAGSRSEMLFNLCRNSVHKLDKILKDIFYKIKVKHKGEKINGIFHCLEGFENLRVMADELDCRLINYSFSAFRRVHGYRQTLYFANLESLFWSGDECKNRYHNFLKKNKYKFPIFSHKELITIIGKSHTLPLIQLINSKPKYEIGICGECYSMMPQVFINKRYTDDDIFYECKKIFGSDKLKIRSHAAHLNDIQVDRSEIHDDPVSTILSCKRLIAVQSQILLKALLWDRTAITKTNCLPFTFLCDDEIGSEKEVDIQGLNYFIFAYLIPSDLMFSNEYWAWRLTNPSEDEIYSLHINHLFDSLGIDKDIVMNVSGVERLKYLLECRKCDQELIDNILSDDIVENINWDIVLSQFELITDRGSRIIWRIVRQNDDGSLTTSFSIDIDGIRDIKFYPLFDVSGLVKCKEVRINGKKITLENFYSEYRFIPKYKEYFNINMSENISRHIEFECTWYYKKIIEYLEL